MMILAHLRKRTCERTGKPLLEASTRYKIPANTPVVLKRCTTHEDCYVLWEMSKRNTTAHKASHEF